MKQHDIVIIGAGVSGLFAAMTLVKYNLDIVIIDIGCSLKERLALLGDNIAENQTKDRYVGFGGLGLSEGKFNYTNDFGGELADKIGEAQSTFYQQQVDQILCQYGGAERELYNTYNAELADRAAQQGFKIFSTQTRHLGTSLSTDILHQFSHYLNANVEFLFNTQVREIEPRQEGIILSLSNQQILKAKRVVIAVGNSGMDWLDPIANQLALRYDNTRLDLGFRIEMHSNQLQSLLSKSIETKIHYQNDDYQATTYCMNPNGRVINKHQGGLTMPDGQNCQEVEQSRNLNFTLFIPKWFTTRQNADRYLTQTITRINQQKGLVAMQLLGEIDHRFNSKKHNITPTLSKAYHTQLAAIAPIDYLHNTCDFLYKLEKLLGEPIDSNTIVYAMDSKMYAPAIKTTPQFETSVANLYVIGDCSGITSSLSQAAANGVYVGDLLRKTLI